jgi:hypothetical protein
MLYALEREFGSWTNVQFLSSYLKEEMSVADLCREYGISQSIPQKHVIVRFYFSCYSQPVLLRKHSVEDEQVRPARINKHDLQCSICYCF